MASLAGGEVAAAGVQGARGSVTGMELCPCRDPDAGATRAVFQSAVHCTASADYTQEQLKAWPSTVLDAAGVIDWVPARAAAHPIVAGGNDGLVGFSNLVDEAVLDMLYVDPRLGRRGVDSALIAKIACLARSAGVTEIETHASVTARPVSPTRSELWLKFVDAYEQPRDTTLRSAPGGAAGCPS
ncbi:MAG: GNAT family N-acetyltransferase [Solirubrobacteraceae bacterium]